MAMGDFNKVLVVSVERLQHRNARLMLLLDGLFLLLVLQFRRDWHLHWRRRSARRHRRMNGRVHFQHGVILVATQNALTFLVVRIQWLGAWHITDCMCQGVTPQITIASEDLAARRTLVRLVIGVRQQVRLQVGPLVEAAIAHGTLVRRLLHVQNLVHGQSARLAESLAALEAFEWLLFRVNVPLKRKRETISKTYR